MGLKEKMMDSMMGNMSKEEKFEMMDKMMEQFFSSMSDEDKTEMMKNIMPKMMQQMMGSGGAGMMGRMMGGFMGKGENSEDGKSPDFNPMDMCKTMMSSMRGGQKVASLATPEIQGLFEDWVEQIENELIDFLPEKETVDIEGIARHFQISDESVYYFISRLAQKGKIHIQMMKN